MALSQVSFDFDPTPPGAGDKSADKQKRGRKKLTETAEDRSPVQVPDDDTLFEKQYYPIGDVAAMFGENTSLIRYWTNEFSILKPRKNKKGDRLFRPEDVKNLKMIHHLLRERKYTIEGAREFLKNDKSAGEKHQMIESLERIKLFLLELKANL